MKNRILISTLFFAALFFACEKNDVTPDLSVAINPAQVVSTNNDTLVIYAGQPVEFQLSGTPNLLTFYSGESGHNYTYRDRITAAGTPKLDISYSANRVNASHRVDILASADFKGAYDSTNIKTAKWDTLTPPELTAYVNNATAKAMPTIALTKYGGGKPVFLAFRLVINSAARYVNPTFSNILIRNYQDDGNVSTVLDNFTAAGMSFVTMSENAKWKSTGPRVAAWILAGSGTSSNITVSTTFFDLVTVDSVYNATDGRTHELWAVSKVLYLDSTLPDVGVTIKNIQQSLVNHNYSYNKTGTYTVTFVGANTGAGGVLGSTVKQLVVKVIAKPAV